MVTFSLFDTLIGLHCEDIMLELLLKYLQPCKHIPLSHRHKVNKIDAYTNVVDFFLELSPEVMKEACDSVAQQQIQPVSKTIGANWNHYGLHTGDSLYSNYHAYLFDARQRIGQCQRSCNLWTSAYRYECIATNRRSEKTMELIRSFLSEFTISDNTNERSKQLDSLQSLGESSGYESFKYRPDDEELSSETDITINNRTTNDELKRKFDSWRLSSKKYVPEIELDYADDLFASQQKAITLGMCKIIQYFLLYMFIN